jgi:hypothetical protein
MPNGVVVWDGLNLMGVAANGIIFMDAFKKVLGKCFVDVGTKGLTDPVCWEPGMIGAAEWKMRGIT